MIGKSLSLPIRIPTKGFFIKTPSPSPFACPPRGEGGGEENSKFEYQNSKLLFGTFELWAFVLVSNFVLRI
jgi:hypothetical protein